VSMDSESDKQLICRAILASIAAGSDRMGSDVLLRQLK